MLSEKQNRIDILMATYQGEAHIESQLLSLIGQTFKSWRLLIHDDGSTDHTLTIIEKYAAFDPRIEIIRDGVASLGAARNFLHLLEYATAPYLIFCDQDDIWFENKLACLLDRHLQYDQDQPIAVYCNGYTYDPAKGTCLNRVTNVFPQKIEDQLFLNAGIQGCSLMFNRALKERLTQPVEVVAMHDHYLSLAALTFGQFVYLDEYLMMYRQGHANKATADIPVGNAAGLLVFSGKHPVVDVKHLEATKAFYQAYQRQFTAAQRTLFQAYFQYADLKTSLWSRVAIVLKYRFNIRNSVFALLIKTLLRPAIR